MAADLVERFVKPVLEELGLRYSDGDDAITFNFRHNGVPMHIGVLDIGVGIPILAIVVNDIVEFPTEQQMSALKLANNLNLQSPGKIMCLRTIGNCFTCQKSAFRTPPAPIRSRTCSSRRFSR